MGCVYVLGAYYFRLITSYLDVLERKEDVIMYVGEVTKNYLKKYTSIITCYIRNGLNCYYGYDHYNNNKRIIGIIEPEIPAALLGIAYEFLLRCHIINSDITAFFHYPRTNLALKNEKHNKSVPNFLKRKIDLMQEKTIAADNILPNFRNGEIKISGELKPYFEEWDNLKKIRASAVHKAIPTEEDIEVDYLAILLIEFFQKSLDIQDINRFLKNVLEDYDNEFYKKKAVEIKNQWKELLEERDLQSIKLNKLEKR